MPMPNPDALMDSWWPIIIAVIIGVFYAFRQYFRGDRCTTTTKFNGKTVIVTGAGGGIGQATALELAKRGARVVLAVKDEVAGEEVASEMRQSSGNVHVTAYRCDLASMASVRKFAEQFKKKESHLHLLVNNAGVMMCPQGETDDKFETHMAVNYIGHFLLTHLLLDHLKSSAPSRVINLCAPAYNIGTINLDDIHGREADYSAGHFLLTHLLLDHLKSSAPSRVINLCAPTYNIGTINLDDIHGHFLLTHLLLDHLKSSAPSRVINLCAPAYNIGTINLDDIHGREAEYIAGSQFSQSKLSVMMFTLEMARRLEDTGVTVNAVNPGVSRTSIHRNMGFRQSAFVEVCIGPFLWFFMKTATDGAQTVLYAATAESTAKDTGKLYKDCFECAIEESAKDEDLQKRLYVETMKWTKLEKDE